MNFKPTITVLLLLIIAIVLAGCVSKEKAETQPIQKQPEAQVPQEVQPPLPPPPPQPSQELPQSGWKLGGIAISGTYADAEIVDLGNGQYRLYYSVEPEVPGNKLELLSSTSSDGITWKKEEGVRKEFATFPDVVKLPDGKFRLYFQNTGVIKSAISQDGLTWADESGVRIDSSESGFNIENVGAQTTMQLDDGTYLMVYRGAINQKYAQDVPNSITTLLFYATSADGINFQKKGIAFDSRTSEFKGWTDGAEWVKWDNNEMRLYFWSYAGIYHITYKHGIFSKDAVFDYTTSNDPRAQFPEKPPGDPTLAKINSKWFMYYGQHPSIYYATYENAQQSQQQILSQSKSQPLKVSGKFIVANPIDLSQITSISKFRSCAGHDYSSMNVKGELEKERSMKHYLAPLRSLVGSTGTIKVFAPFDGTITSIEEEQVAIGKQVWISGPSTDEWIFVFFHISLLPGLKKGSAVKAGQLLGYADLPQNAHDFDIALKKFQLFSGQVLDSPFNYMAPSVLQHYDAKGVTVDNVITSKETRDASPCTTFGGGEDNSQDWVILK